MFKLVTVDDCTILFGNHHGNRKKFRYTNCKDRRIVGKIEKMWPLLISKTEMPTNNLLSLEFIMGIMAKKKDIKINWAAFGEDVNFG